MFLIYNASNSLSKVALWEEKIKGILKRTLLAHLDFSNKIILKNINQLLFSLIYSHIYYRSRQVFLG